MGHVTDGRHTTDGGHAEPVPAGGPVSADVVVRGQQIALSGTLDVRGAADVRLLLAAAVVQGRGELVLDLAGLAAIDATGLGVLVGAHRRAGRAGRVLVLRDVQPAVRRLLFLTRLDRVLRIAGSAQVA